MSLCLGRDIGLEFLFLSLQIERLSPFADKPGFWNRESKFVIL